MRRFTPFAILAAVGLALAGCGTSNEPSDDTSTGAENTPEETTAAATDEAETPDDSTEAGGSDVSGDVEVFTWWTAGSEALGLEALQGVLAAKYPDVNFINGGVTGGGGSAKELLQTRLQANQPPDSFQVHAGKEAQDYIDAGQVTDVSALYEEFGLTDVFPQDLLDMLTQDGKIYTIPSNVHRANVLWASVPALEQAGIDPQATTYASVDDFIADLQKIQDSTDLIPLSIGGTWTQVHLLECVLIAELGPEAYLGLFDGTTDWAGSEVGGALEKFGTLIGFTNDDRDQYDWEPASQMVVDGTAVFNVMGDWVPALLDSTGLVDGTDYVWAPAPGTDGVYDFLADSFSLAQGAPHPDGAKAWLDVISSADGQEAFNKVKGSIPARTDLDLAALGFSDYQQQAAQSFATDAIVGSIQHGAAATIQQGNATNDAVSKFTTSGSTDLETFQSELAAAYAG
ncbi:MAG: ABC transporter substrate-binding protein [Bifidobacteriaceae bacterium]|jgi:glucose/mannose transport system substrate-binding protein|nr:ABC transporter substrate-binding protein [Bifidobacteriaceae bacterium]